MTQQFNQPNFKIKTSILLFGKGWATPVVLYFDNPEEKYKELQDLISSQSSKVIELCANGPIKKITINASQISSVAMQEEQHVV